MIVTRCDRCGRQYPHTASTQDVEGPVQQPPHAAVHRDQLGRYVVRVYACEFRDVQGVRQPVDLCDRCIVQVIADLIG